MDLTRPDGTPLRVLVVDDEVNIAELISMALRFEGFDVSVAHTGAKAVSGARSFGPDAVVLDVMLPDFDGLEVLRRMRTTDPDVPVLFLTARDAVEDRIAGLTAGGDDYVTKPFSLEELVARLRGLMRRTGARRAESASVLVVGDLELDEDSHEVRRAGDEIMLTATEFELLRFLMRNPERVLSKAQILDRVWNYDFGGQANVVELYISYLRKKVDVGPRADDPHHARCGVRAEAGDMKRSRVAHLAPGRHDRRLVRLVSVLIGDGHDARDAQLPDRPARPETCRPRSASCPGRPGARRTDRP